MTGFLNKYAHILYKNIKNTFHKKVVKQDDRFGLNNIIMMLL